MGSSQLGRTRLFMLVWIFLHLIALSLSLVHYDLKDNLVGARKVFGYTFGASPGSTPLSLQRVHRDPSQTKCRAGVAES